MLACAAEGALGALLEELVCRCIGGVELFRRLLLRCNDAERCVCDLAIAVEVVPGVAATAVELGHFRGFCMRRAVAAVVAVNPPYVIHDFVSSLERCVRSRKPGKADEV